MEPIEVSKLDQILTRLDAQDTQLASIYGFVNETNVVVKDILQGRQLSEWITDLVTSGTSSATYGNGDRMNMLIADSDACKNTDVTQYLLDWAVAHNKAGTYYNSVLGPVSGATWANLTTADSVMANSASFTAVAANNTTFTASMNNSTCRTAIYNNAATTENIILASSVAMAVLNAKKQRIQTAEVSGGTKVSGKYFAFSGFAYKSTLYWTNVAGGTGGAECTGTDSYTQQVPINKFISDIQFVGSRTQPIFMYVVDFS